MVMDERKRPYNSLKRDGECREPTEEEMEAYKLNRRTPWLHSVHILRPWLLYIISKQHPPSCYQFNNYAIRLTRENKVRLRMALGSRLNLKLSIRSNEYIR